MYSTQEKIEKVYHTISEVANKLNVSKSKIRFYESQFEWLDPKRNLKNNRKYKLEDIEKLNTVTILADAGLSMVGIQRAYDDKYLAELAVFFLEKSKSKTFSIW